MDSHSRVDLGPLTTTFTPAPTCTDGMNVETTVYGWWGSTGYCRRITGSDSEDIDLYVAATGCWPTPFVSMCQSDVDKFKQDATTSPTYLVGMFSPGHICPKGFTSACRMTKGDQSAVEDALTVLALLKTGEIAVACCRTGHTCYGYQGKISCSATVTSGALMSGTVDGACSPSSSTVVSVATEGFLDDDAVLLVRQQSDEMAPTQTGIVETDEPGHNSAGGLSTGAKIAIGATVPSVILLLVGSIIGFLLIKKNRMARPGERKLSSRGKWNSPGVGNDVGSVMNNAMSQDSAAIPEIDTANAAANMRYEMGQNHPTPQMLDSVRTQHVSNTDSRRDEDTVMTARLYSEYKVHELEADNVSPVRDSSNK